MLSAFSVGALALSLLFVKEAKADQVTEGRPAPEDTTDQGTSTQAVSAVNKVEVDAAKDSLDQKNEQVKEGEAAVKEAEKSVETAKANAELAKEAVKTAEEGTQASSVTKEAAREAVTNQTEAVKEAEKVAQASQTELDKSQNQANSQAQKTQEAKEALKKEDEKVNQAQADLEQAQKTQAGSSAEVSANLEQAKVDVANSQVAVNKAQEEVNKAEQSDSQRQEKIDQAVSNKAQADSDAEKSKQALDKASSQEAEAQAKLSQAQASLEAAQASLKPSVSNNKNRLYMTPEYIAALKQLADPNTPQSQISQIEATLTAVNDKAKSYNNYIADSNDSTKMYDTNNIPYEVRRELSQFASELINQLRAQMGTGETLLTPSSLEFADKVSQAYRNDNWNWDLMNRYHHDTWGINRVAREYGLVTTTSEQEQQGLQYYENAYIWRANTAQMSVADMKRDIYFSLVEFMYNGYEWVHAKSISGLNTGSQKNYLGVDFSMESDITVAHFTMVSED